MWIFGRTQHVDAFVDLPNEHTAITDTQEREGEREKEREKEERKREKERL